METAVTTPLAFGPVLSDEVYQSRVVALYTGLPDQLSPEQETQIRRKSLDFAIDHRLGVGFPADRREAMWQVQQRIHRNHVRVAGALIFTGLFRLLAPTRWAARLGWTQGSSYVRNQFGRVLDPNELEHFLGDPEPFGSG